MGAFLYTEQITTYCLAYISSLTFLVQLWLLLQVTFCLPLSIINTFSSAQIKAPDDSMQTGPLTVCKDQVRRGTAFERHNTLGSNDNSCGSFLLNPVQYLEGSTAIGELLPRHWLHSDTSI